MGVPYKTSLIRRRNRPSDPNAILGQLLETLELIADSVEDIRAHLIPTGVAEFVEFYNFFGGEYRKVDKMFMKIDQVADLAVAFKDKLGNLAKVDGLPTWAVTDESLGKLEVAADGMSAVLSLLAVGTFKVQVKADADLGSGIKEIIGELDVEVSALEAEVVEISATIR